MLEHFADLVKPTVRETMFPALDKKRLILALKRYRDVHAHFQAGRDLPGLQVLARLVMVALAMCLPAQRNHDRLSLLLQAVVKRSAIDGVIKKLLAEP